MAAEQPWHASFPTPKTTKPASLTPDEVLSMLRAGGVGRDFVLVDIRRNDYEFVAPLTSLRKPFFQRFLRSINYSRVLAFDMSSGFVVSSSQGRGTRAAGWFNDHIQEQGDIEMQSAILLGGVKGWATAGEEFVWFMDGYVPEHWAQFQF
ncbi:Rhodanese-like domain-containing protein [Xylaria palmicola]|nr:Rhodanese-like domain-containing protein [Xylaria palmicola]